MLHPQISRLHLLHSVSGRGIHDLREFTFGILGLFHPQFFPSFLLQLSLSRIKIWSYFVRSSLCIRPFLIRKTTSSSFTFIFRMRDSYPSEFTFSTLRYLNTHSSRLYLCDYIIFSTKDLVQGLSCLYRWYKL